MKPGLRDLINGLPSSYPAFALLARAAGDQDVRLVTRTGAWLSDTVGLELVQGLLRLGRGGVDEALDLHRKVGNVSWENDGGAGCGDGGGGGGG